MTMRSRFAVRPQAAPAEPAHDESKFISTAQQEERLFLIAQVNKSKPLKNGYMLSPKCDVDRADVRVVPMIAFCGHTGNGKSHLLSQLIVDEDFQQCIRPHIHPPKSDGPESSDVSIFRGINFGIADFEFTYLLDCEGSNASKPGRMLTRLFAAELTADLALQRIAVVDKILPTLVYSFCDVIVYVTRSRLFDAGTIRELMEFAERAMSVSSTPWRPALVVVQNSCPSDETEDFEESTRKFVNAVDDYASTNVNMLNLNGADVHASKLGDLFNGLYAVTVGTHNKDRTVKLPMEITGNMLDAIAAAIEKIPNNPRRMQFSAKTMFEYIEKACDVMQMGTLNLASASDIIATLNHVDTDNPGRIVFDLTWLLVSLPERTNSKFNELVLITLSYVLALLAAEQAKAVGLKRDVLSAQVKTAVEVVVSGIKNRQPCMEALFAQKCTQERLGHEHTHRNPNVKLGSLPFPLTWRGDFNDGVGIPHADIERMLERTMDTAVTARTIMPEPDVVDPLQKCKELLKAGGMPPMISEYFQGILSNRTVSTPKPVKTGGSSASITNYMPLTEFLIERQAFIVDMIKLQQAATLRKRDDVSFNFKVAAVKSLMVQLANFLKSVSAKSGVPDLPFCVLCGKVSQELGKANCPHKFCSSCHEQMLKSASPRCCICNNEVDGFRSGKSQPLGGPRLLCLDSGGSRNLYSLCFLESVMGHVGKLVGRQVHVNEAFDLIGGTSIGGVLALALAKRTPLDVCHTLLQKIFLDVMKPTWGFAMAGRTDELEELLKQYLSDSDLSDSPAVFVTAADTRKHNKLVVLSNYVIPHKDESNSELLQINSGLPQVVQACMATCATPQHLKPVEMHLRYVLQDGGFKCINPSSIALDHAAVLWQTVDMTVTPSGILPKSEANSARLAEVCPKLPNVAVLFSVGAGDSDKEDLRKQRYKKWYGGTDLIAPIFVHEQMMAKFHAPAPDKPGKQSYPPLVICNKYVRAQPSGRIGDDSMLTNKNVEWALFHQVIKEYLFVEWLDTVLASQRLLAAMFYPDITQLRPDCLLLTVKCRLEDVHVDNLPQPAPEIIVKLDDVVLPSRSAADIMHWELSTAATHVIDIRLRFTNSSQDAPKTAPPRSKEIDMRSIPEPKMLAFPSDRSQWEFSIAGCPFTFIPYNLSSLK